MLNQVFRIKTVNTELATKGVNERVTRGLDAEPSNKYSDYMTRLITLVPSEVIGVYLIGKSMAASLIGIWGLICLLLVVFVRCFGTYDANKSNKIQWLSVVISSISYIIWVYAIGSNILGLELPSNYIQIPSLFVLVWTFIIPYFYKGDTIQP